MLQAARARKERARQDRLAAEEAEREEVRSLQQRPTGSNSCIRHKQLSACSLDSAEKGLKHGSSNEL
jgi:hypothetical protein